MALHHHHFALFLSTSSSEWRSTTSTSVFCRNQPTRIAFRRKLARTVMRTMFDHGSVSVRGSKFDQGFDLEGEIFEFMKSSERPNMFPSKEELMAAGRRDLVNAIVKEGGWLSAGWDWKEGEEDEREDLEIREAKDEHFQYSDTCLPSDNGGISSFASHSSSVLSNPTFSSCSSSSGQSTRDMKHGGGIEGMLSRLEKERASFLAVEPREKKGTRSRREEASEDARCSWGTLTKMYGDKMRKSPAVMSEGNGLLLSSNTTKVHLDGPEQHSLQHYLNNNDDGSNPHYILRVKSLREDNHVETNSVNGNGRKPLSSNSSIDDINLNDEEDFDDQENHHKTYQESIRNRIQTLESELSSMIQLVRSGTSTDNWTEEYANSLEKLHELSNAWEFYETEIMKSRAKLRSTRAKLAILEGKMALEIMETQKVVEEKQKQIEKAQRVLGLLRTACIVWSNSGNDVLLAGSFDGWTSQRRMDRTSSGIFTLNLKLYPGRYEIKFIVDGVWRIDPLRPIVNNNGYENNLLIIS